MKASFTISSKATIKIGSVVQENNITANDFSNKVTYSVIAEDLSTKNYEVSLAFSGIAPSININSTTSYYTYLQNKLYINLATVIPNTPLYGPYFADAYNARAYADFDKDGDLDIMAVSFNYTENIGLDVEYFRNNGSSFTKDQSVFNGNIPQYVHGRKAIVADLDKNGWPDVIIAGHGFDQPPFPGETVKLMMNTNGKFTTKDLGLPAGFYHSICAGDIDNDGDVDLFLTNNLSVGKFMKNDGTGNFTYDASLFPSELANKNYYTSELYDINNDGYLDLVNTGHEMDGANSVILWGNYTGKYSTSRITTLPKVINNQIAIDINFMDFNKDGKMDIVLVRTGDNTGPLKFYQGYYIQMLRNDGGTFTDVTTSVIPQNADPNAPKWINWIRTQDIDGDGNLDITTDDKFYGLEWKNNNGVFVRQ
ncbi:MAG: VCBS repeat-containing protein [Sphingobacteriales bacterium]|nr:VCBS repeat-containing protein [Sphingobacteriales bacterium]